MVLSGSMRLNTSRRALILSKLRKGPTPWYVFSLININNESSGVWETLTPGVFFQTLITEENNGNQCVLVLHTCIGSDIFQTVYFENSIMYSDKYSLFSGLIFFTKNRAFRPSLRQVFLLEISSAVFMGCREGYHKK
jgi:hypothetical protein